MLNGINKNYIKSHISSVQVLPSNEFPANLKKSVFQSTLDFRIAKKGYGSGILLFPLYR